MFFLKERYPIGIDISNDDLYAAQFRETRQGLVLGGLFHRELTRQSTDSADFPETLVPVLREIARDRHFRGKSAAIHLPAQCVYSFPVRFDLNTGQDLEKAIVQECRGHLSLSLEEVIIDYASIDDFSSGRKRKIRANVVAARRDQIALYSRLLKRAGLSVEVIDFDLSSLMRLHNFLQAAENDPVILCDIGHSKSLIAVVTPDRILAHRKTPWGIKHVLSRIETNFEFPENRGQASAMLKKYGLQYETCRDAGGDIPAAANPDMDNEMEIYRTIFQILTPYVDVLVHEFYQITGYVRSEMQHVKFGGICMYGRAGAIRALDQYLEKRINIPTKCIEPLSKLSRPDNSPQPDSLGGAPFAQALGLAMRKVTWL